ncbi:MAG: FAD-dependent oxidoreductase, partial [Bacteroidia bacterium]|nr:FAD-dependent oxidoreductase [Bacteroidia bacterium]
MKDTPKKKRAIVVGSGIAGLASAIRLQFLGFEVDVFEQNSTYGGKIGVWSKNGYRFDTGPSLFTMPHFVEELLLLDAKHDINFKYEKLNVLCNYFWNDGTELTAYADQDKLEDEFETVLGEPKENIRKFLRKSKEKYEITNHVFLEKSLHRVSTYLNLRTLKSILQLHKVQIFKKMNTENRKVFVKNKTIQFFNRYATYNGSNPYQAPATLNVIPHYEFGFGAFFPKKGIRSIADSLFEKAQNLGVQFHFNVPVTAVKRKPSGFQINNEHSADVVVCNMDVAAASKGPFSELISTKRKSYEPSSSAVIFYWGIKKKFPELDVHNIFFSANYEEEFNTLFKDYDLADDLTVYVH